VLSLFPGGVDPNYPNFKPNVAADDSIIANLRSPVRYTTRYSQISQELRLASHLPEDGDLPLKWVVGLYYSQQWIHNTNFQQIPGLNAAFKKHLRRSAGAKPGQRRLRRPGDHQAVSRQRR
jgi:hypothetical protein